MQAVKPDNVINAVRTQGLAGVSAEVLAYVVVIVLALIFRLADVDLVPMTDAEAVQANATWQILQPDAPGEAATPQSPIVFWMQHIFFTLLGPTEFTARLPGIIGGILLALMPALYRRWFGPERAFIASVLLAFGPIPLLASRSADPVIWMLLSALLLIWALSRYREVQSSGYALLAVVGAAGLLFLTDSGGPILALILALSAWLSLRWPAQPHQTDGAGLAAIRSDLVGMPWQNMLLLMALVVLVVSTGFMIYPGGLGHVAALWGATLGNWTQPPVEGAIFGFPVLTMLFYNGWAVFFAIVAYVLLQRNGQFPFAARFLGAWLLLATLVLLIYRGAEASAALWLSVPVLALAAYAGYELMRPFGVMVYWSDEAISRTGNPYSFAYGWVKWMLALATLAILLMLGVHLQEIGRGLLIMPDGAGLSNLLADPAFIRMRYSTIWLIVTILFVIVGYMLSVSIWGSTNTLQGLGLGAFVFMIGTGLGSGWNAAVANASSPAELWHTHAISPDAYTLRETFIDIARRDTGWEPQIPVTVVMDDGILRADGLVAWLLRDFSNAQFVRTLGEAQRAQIVLMPAMEELPDLGGSYVGQSYSLRQRWDPASLRVADMMALVGQRRLGAFASLETDRVVLWLRQDVFDGVPLDQRP